MQRYRHGGDHSGITTAVIPFIQTLVTEATKDAYNGAKALIRRWCQRQHEPTDTVDESNERDPAESERSTHMLRIKDPELRITLHIHFDLPPEAIRALGEIDIYNLAAGSDSGELAHLFWHTDAQSW